MQEPTNSDILSKLELLDTKLDALLRFQGITEQQVAEINQAFKSPDPDGPVDL